MIGVVILFVLVMGNISYLVSAILPHSSNVADYEKVIDTLQKKYPHKKFAVYDYKGSLSYWNQPLGLFLYKRNLTSSDGMPIGILCFKKCPEQYRHILVFDGMYVADLSSEKNIQKNKKQWINVNPQNMYDDLIGWSQRHELRSNFTLSGYLQGKFGNMIQ